MMGTEEITKSLIDSLKKTFLEFAVNENDRKSIEMLFNPETVDSLISYISSQGFSPISEEYKSKSAIIKQKVDELINKHQVATSDEEKGLIIEQMTKVQQELKELENNEFNNMRLLGKSSMAEFSKKQPVNDLEKVVPIFKELQDRLKIKEDDNIPDFLAGDLVKTIKNQVDYRKAMESDKKRKNNKKEHKLKELPQLFKDPKKLEKILSILVHEENRYVLKDEEGNYTWNTKKIKLVAFALYCLNKNLLNESMQNFSTKVRESFCDFFSIEITQRSFQNTTKSEYYLKEFEILLK